ncbi:MAG TPA: WbqC family protein [Saprospiraceae bacterium]|nr:WbqC family protein [Saprospiraceae bacterium]HNT18838.1 WbqC family protein [Saprospiraceae bacterium]
MDDATTLVATEYFPRISTVRQMMLAQKVWLAYGETYQKNSLRNRCYLASGQGLQRLSVPLRKGKHQSQKIYKVKIAYEEDWPLQHLKAMETNYRSAPFFLHFVDPVRLILESRPEYLVDLNWKILSLLFNVFRWHPDIACHMEFSSPAKSTISPTVKLRPYNQVFAGRFGFLADLSILDLLFCMGPEPKYILP